MKTIIRGAQKVVDPPIFMPDDGIVLPVRTTPGGINYYRAGTSDKIFPLETKGRVDIGFQVVDDVRRRIKDAFFVSQMQLPQGPQKTATEVLQITEENSRLQSPLLGRQQDELLTIIVNRQFNLMLRKELFLPVPDVLKGVNVTPRYSSTLARAQRVGEAQNLFRGIELLAPIAQSQPEVIDNLNGDEYFRFIANTFGFPQEISNTVKKRTSIREARANAEQAEKQRLDDRDNVEDIAKVAPVLQTGS